MGNIKHGWNPTINKIWLLHLLLKQPTECEYRDRGVGKIGHGFIHEMDVYIENFCLLEEKESNEKVLFGQNGDIKWSRQL